jgi:hypothetical protein
MMIISQIAQPPATKEAKEIIRFMLQSLDKDQEYHIKFLVGCMEHLYRKGSLTQGQMKAIISIYSEFVDSMRVQYPHIIVRHKKTFEDPLPPPPEPEKYTEGNVVFLNKNKAEE